MESDKLLTVSRRYLTHADNSFRRERIRKNEANWMAYRGEQDFTYKNDYQSRETTPGFPIAIEHIVGTFERALTDSDDWLSADLPGIGEPFLDPDLLPPLLQFYLQRLYTPGNHPETAYGIAPLVSDMVKRGLLEPMVIVKVHPVVVRRRIVKSKQAKATEPGAQSAFDLTSDPTSQVVDEEFIRLAIDLIAYEDYYRDPSPSCRYEIQRTRRALHELLANPEYDKDAVRRLIGKAQDDLRTKRASATDNERRTEAELWEVDVFECWGDIIDPGTGELLHENVFWTWAGDEILRAPTPNPCWDGTRPFVSGALIRVPGSVEGKALADHAVPMWKATNELVNLLLDQAMRAAWGVGQLRPDIMESPEEVAAGVPQGYVGVLKPNAPLNAKFYERVDEGEAPQISLEQLNRLEGFLQEALATPDTKLGTLPNRATKATEIVQAMQSSGSLFESFAARFEDTILEPIFEKCWRLLLQWVTDLAEDELVQILGATNVLRLEEMTTAQRFRMLSKAHFRVRGLRGVASKERTFNKLMTIVNLLGTNPQFADHFGQTRDFNKLWDQLVRATGIDPLTLQLEAGPEEEAVPPDEGAVPPEVAAGQLNPALAAGNGASQPNIPDATAAQGAESLFAANNPQANLAVAG